MTEAITVKQLSANSTRKVVKKDWLAEQLERRNFSVRRFSLEIGLSHTQISNVLTGKRNITFDFCKAVADGLGEPPEMVFRLAGLLPDLPNDPDDPNLKRLLEIGQSLSANDLRDLVEYGEYRRKFSETVKGKL